MIRFALCLTILALFASPLFAQSLPERLAQVEANNKALADAVTRVEAGLATKAEKGDVDTLRMGQNVAAAEIDALKAEVWRLKKAAPTASQAWASAPATTQTYSASYSSGPQMVRVGLFGRVRVVGGGRASGGAGG